MISEKDKKNSQPLSITLIVIGIIGGHGKASNHDLNRHSKISDNLTID